MLYTTTDQPARGTRCSASEGDRPRARAARTANYNWELLFHIPLTIAVHLSKNQRFAEAQRWFHYIFDPTSNDDVDADAPQRFWKFLRFRNAGDADARSTSC